MAGSTGPFAGSRTGSECAAAIFSIIEIAPVAGVGPQAWLTQVASV